MGLGCMQGYCIFIVSAIAAAVVPNALYPNSVVAQITPDATLPNNSNVKLEDKTFNITGGTSAGINLFHSFKDFSVPSGWEAVFKNGADIQNILTRVSGKSISQIDGLIKANGSANLFLMNPNGIVFGENARLDIGGSFLATSASGMKFSDGSEFSATNPQAPPLLKVNITPGLQYGTSQPGATISNTANLTSQQDLKLVADKLDLQGELKAGRDLTLQAQDTVKVRDNVTTPFLAQAGGNLTIQGNQGIDILALNHPTQSPFVSGGDLSLISDGIISGDARFTSGGNFSLNSVSGQVANFVSKYDPIISSNGDVDVAANYTGASLLVESKGNIRFGGQINITIPDISNLPTGQDTATLSNSTALIVRSGQNTLAYGGVNSVSVPGFTSGNLPEGITIDGNVFLQPFNGAGGIVDLTTASGDINAQQIVTNGGAIDVSSGGAINTGNLFAYNGMENGGDIRLEAKNGNIFTGGLYSYSYSESGSAGSGGDIRLESTNGGITTNDLYSYSYSESGNAGSGGAINLKAANGDITTGNLYSTSDSRSGSGGNGGAIGFRANGNISTGSMNSEAGSTGNGGDITLTSNAGAIDTTSGAIASEIREGSNGTGRAGTIVFTAKNNIQTAELDASAEKGDGSSIQLTSTNGKIDTTKGTVYTESRSGNAGAIFLSAFNNITTGRIVSEVEDTGNGGNITLTSNAGAIDTTSGDITSEIRQDSNGTGRAGTIVFTAKNNIQTAELDASAEKGDGSSIQLTSTNGEIDTTKGTVYTESRSGNTANIQLQALSNIRTANIISTINSSDKLARGGDITLISENGEVRVDGTITTNTYGSSKGGDINITTGSLSLTDGAQLSTSTFGQGDGGNVKVLATDSVSLVNANIFSTVERGGAGNGGDININAASLSLKGAQLQTLVREASDNKLAGRRDAGNVNVVVTGAVTIAGKKDSYPSGIFSELGTETIGKGGNITISSNSLSLTDGAFLSASTSGQGDTGSITINAPDRVSFDNAFASNNVNSGAVGDAGGIDITTGSLFMSNAELNVSTFGQGDGGTVNITASDTVSLNGAFARSDVGSTAIGEGGDINITTGSLSIKENGLLTSSTSGKGNAGSINIIARNTVSLDDRDVDQYLTGLSSVAGYGSVGKGGNINIQAEHLSIKNNAALNADVEPTGKGKGGDINLDVKGTILLTTEETYTLKGESARITLGVQPGGIGSGGTLKIKAGSLVLRNGGIIKDSTQGHGNAGNIQVNADVVDISGSVPSSGLPSGLFTSTNTTGKAGDIIIDTQIFRIADGAALSARTNADGQGGIIGVNANTFEAINGGQLVSTTSGKGQAGNIFVNATDRVTISGTDINYNDRIVKFPTNNQFVANDIKETGAASGLIVNSTGSANAGNIEATADFIRLEEQGRITAESASAGNGGNITLNVGKLLLLRRGNSSQISTTAGTASVGGDGGDITINAPNGFLVAIPNENSDITANAFKGRGGNINIGAREVFGIQRREQQTPQSDITATGATPDLSGTVQINTADTDPNNGLIELPVNLVDASNQISKACTPGGSQFQNEFISTGRGGLPMNPTQPLQETSTLQAWVKLKPQPETTNTTIKPPLKKVSSISNSNSKVNINNQIVEATGWIVDKDGNIEFVAQANQVNPQSIKQTSAACSVSK